MSALSGPAEPAGQRLPPEACGALERLLAGAAARTELTVANCSLDEEGIKLLLHSLCSNTTVKSLDLKGNNLRAVGAEALGKLLAQNKSIRSLILEWNSLGMWEEDFFLFCQGLAANSVLQRLDLRSNEISHQGAEELAMALKKNTTLQELDLRWNNIGLLGGRALLNCLHSNKTLQRLELAGNNVPSDVLKAIELTMTYNQDRQAILSESQNRAHVLSEEVLRLKDEKTKQFLDLMDTIDKQKEERAKSDRMATGRVRKLQEALDEQHSMVNSLKAKLQMTEAALALSEQKVHDLGELLNAAKRDQTRMAECHFKELQQQKKEIVDREGKLLRDLSAASEKNLLLKNQVDELERKCKVQQDQLFQVKQDLTNRTAELKLQAVQAEEHQEMEKKRFKQRLEDMESLRVKEVDCMRQHLETSERSMQDRIQRLEAIRVALEEELSQVKAAALAECSRAQEELIEVRNQARLEEQQRREHLEEKLQQMTESLKKAQNCYFEQNQTFAEAKAAAAQLRLHADGLERQLEELQQNLKSKEEEKVTEVTKVKVELQAERTAQAGLREKIAALEREMKALSSNHREALLDKEGEISMLVEKLRRKDAEISRMREEEAQRASFLQNAIMTYVQGCSLQAPSSSK